VVCLPSLRIASPVFSRPAPHPLQPTIGSADSSSSASARSRVMVGSSATISEIAPATIGTACDVPSNIT